MSKNRLRLWRAPRSAREIEGRHVSYLELFYDLVYVVIVSVLSHSLAEDISAESIYTFIFLYILILLP